MFNLTGRKSTKPEIKSEDLISMIKLQYKGFDLLTLGLSCLPVWSPVIITWLTGAVYQVITEYLQGWYTRLDHCL